MKCKKVVQIALAGFLAFPAIFPVQSATGSAVGNTFSDSAGHWGERYIESSAKDGIMNGYDDGRFRPDSAITREEVAATLSRYDRKELKTPISKETPLSDIGDRWSTEEIEYLTKRDIIHGYPDGTFRPENKITREEVAVLIYNLLESRLAKDAPKSFSDETFLFGAKEASVLAGNGIVSGTGNNIYEPARSITRAEIATIVQNMDRFLGHYDVIVYGSELESVSAAVSASRENQNVLLLYEKRQVGGLLVDGYLNYVDVPESDGEYLLKGLAAEFYYTFGSGYDFEDARRWMLSRLEEQDVDSVRADSLKVAQDSSGKIVSIENSGKIYTADVFIDASENGDFMAKTSAEYFIGMADIGRKTLAGSTLIYELSGVDYGQIRASVGEDSSTEKYAWGFGEELDQYKPLSDNIVVRGPNIALLDNGNVVLNHVVNVSTDPLDSKSIETSKAEMKTEIENLIKFMRANLAGFQNASIVSYADDLYLRESRHFKGSYALSLKDICNRTLFEDKIAVTNYPVDVHAASDNKQNLIVYSPKSYEIPYRSIHNNSIPNLLVSSKCASYSSIASGSTRIVMTGTMVSEAAGIAASISSDQKIPVQKVNAKDIQDELRTRGFDLTHPGKDITPLPQDVLDKLNTGYYSY